MVTNVLQDLTFNREINPSVFTFHNKVECKPIFSILLTIYLENLKLDYKGQEENNIYHPKGRRRKKEILTRRCMISHGRKAHKLQQSAAQRTVLMKLPKYLMPSDVHPIPSVQEATVESVIVLLPLPLFFTQASPKYAGGGGHCHKCQQLHFSHPPTQTHHMEQVITSSPLTLYLRATMRKSMVSKATVLSQI